MTKLLSRYASQEISDLPRERNNHASIESRLYELHRNKISCFNNLVCTSEDGKADVKEKVKTQLGRLPELLVLPGVEYRVNRKSGDIEVYRDGRLWTPN